MPARSTEMWSGQRSSVIYSGPNLPNNWTAERAWQVDGALTDSQARNAIPIDNPPRPIPTIGAQHDENSRLQVVELPVEAKSPLLKIVRAIYVIPTGSLLSDDPLLAPPIINWQIGTESQDADADVASNAIVNSSNDPLDSYVQVAVPVANLTVTRNEPFFNVGKAIQFVGKVNAGAFSIAGAGLVGDGQCLCLGIVSAGGGQVVGQSYVTVTYSFALREQGWKLRILDRGALAFDANGKKGDITFLGGQHKGDATGPVCLDGYGRPADQASFEIGRDGGVGINPDGTPAGAVVVESASGQAVWLEWKIRKQVSFAGLV